VSEILGAIARLLDDNISLERAYYEIHADRLRGRAAESTVEALMYSLRRGTEALTGVDGQCRLSELVEEQLRDICARSQIFKPNIAPAWTPEEIKALISIWSTIHVT
jgi:hypothetical protein